MLLRIILLPLLVRFSLIYRMWVFQIIHDRPLERANWAFVLGWSQGPGCFIGRASSLSLRTYFSNPIRFQTSINSINLYYNYKYKILNKNVK